MSLVRWFPRRNGLQSVAVDTQLDRLFEDFFSSAPLRTSLSPAVDVEETTDAYVFRADLPGMSSKDVKVSVHNDTLTLRGERKQETQKSEGSLYRVERAYGSFERSFTLGLPVRADQVKASYKDGVLELTAPAPKGLAARKVPIEVDENKK